jgi:competence protein ComEA
VLPVVRERLEELAARLGLPSPPPAALVAGVALVLVLAAWAVVRTGALGGASGASDEFAASSPVEAVPTAGPVPAAARSAEPTAPPTIVVHVAGAVRHPGVYRLPSGSRGDDAVKAAGGTLGNADTDAINLARQLADGEQLVVPVQGEAPAAVAPSDAGGSGAAAPAVTPAGKVPLNSATAEQLDALPGIGPATAAKIVADREKNGPFATPEDLARVPGIGPKKVDGLKDLVSAP